METTSVTTVTSATGELIQEETTVSSPASSSVEIATDSKGQAKLTVKVYSVNPDEALAKAYALYREGTKALAELQQRNLKGL